MNVNAHDLSYTLNLYQNMQVTLAPLKYCCLVHIYTHVNTQRRKRQNSRTEIRIHAYTIFDENFTCLYNSCFLTIFNVLDKTH